MDTNTKRITMKKIIYLVAAVAIIAVIVLRLKSNKETTEQRVYQFNKEQAINVQTDTISLDVLRNQISYTGTFEPFKETKISAEIQGKINALYVDVGTAVKKGQPVIQLDKSLLELQLENVEIQIEGLEADVKRFTILSGADAIQGVQLEKAELGLKSARVQRATLLEQINKTTIKSPFDGVVTAKLSEEGAFAAPGVPLLQITDIVRLKFTINVPEHELNQFQLHQTYAITSDVFAEISLPGKITMIGSKANVGNSFPVHLTVTNTTDLKIKSGMFGRVEVNNSNGEKIIIIPSSSIIGTTIQPQVYVVKGGKAVLQDVSISRRIQNQAVVTNGLNDGDIIVINGFVNLFDGANVIVN